MRICWHIEGFKVKRSSNLCYLQYFRISKMKFRLYTMFIKLCSHSLHQGNINRLKNLQTVLLNYIIRIQDSVTQFVSELLRNIIVLVYSRNFNSHEIWDLVMPHPILARCCSSLYLVHIYRGMSDTYAEFVR
jgi:hypothetical protein